MSLRFHVVEAANKKQPVEVPQPAERPAKYFAKYVFNQEKMFRYLPRDTYRALRRAIEQGEPLSREVADSVAGGMKQWAIEMGATHCTHWFQPLTEGTAEKHDAFVEHDGKGGMIEEFTGKMLVQQEPDASSFPSGGIRSTFEARGYSAWDPASPVFILGDTLMIPTVFIAYTGEALDYKAPLKKSLAALDKAATRVAQLFNPDVRRVTCNLGWEQEYFLVDADLYAARPDLVMTGRTLLGHSSAKNQQMDDHYFGAIPERVQAFMRDLEIQALELGIPCKTRHNEVAPNQFELAPIYEECNLAVDHNMLLMSLMQRVARKHGFHCLLHEKPFAGVNGSGKHENWSLSTDTGILLHSPGKTPEDNLRFAVFIVETLMGVYRHNGLLKASIMSATNAHRLGANEAPPAIISSFLGRYLEDMLDQIVPSTPQAPLPSPQGGKLQSRDGGTLSENVVSPLGGTEGGPGTGSLKLDIPQIPEILIDNTDRNRTSPFAFTGNRFEFRAVGSSANCASALIALNTAVAEALTDFYERVAPSTPPVGGANSSAEDSPQAESPLRGGYRGAESLRARILEVLRDDIRTCRPIRFCGNGYSDEWKQEAERRGLDVETSCPVIFEQYLVEPSVGMFERMNVMNRKELAARNEVKWETYVKAIQIEARVLGDLAMNHIIPVATHYQSKLIKNVQGVRDIFSSALFSSEKATRLSARNVKLIEEIAERTERIEQLVEELTDARRVANRVEDVRERAILYHDTVCPKMEAIRTEADKLEMIVEDGLWPLPKYRELLFIR